MTGKALVYRALDHEQVPRAPYSIGFTEQARDMMATYFDDEDFGKEPVGDMVSSPVIQVEFGVRDADGTYIDEFGVKWDRSRDPDIGMPRPSLTPDTLDDFVWPDPRSAGRFKVLESNLARYPDKFQLMALDLSLYERAWALRGLENFLIDMIANPGFAEALLDRILEFNLGIIDEGLSRFPEVDAVYFGDDFGTQRGVVMGESRWCELLRPRLAKQYQRVKEWGRKVFIHSCGAVAELFPHLVEIGIDCFNPFQPEVMDVYALKNQYSGRLAFWGGISTQRLLPFGTGDEVRSEIRKLQEMAKTGGYIVAPAHAIPGDAKPENVAIILEMLGFDSK
jgi:uroporphyrinogen decarboxylase